MISKDSTSYPYLAVAQHFNVPYAEVLKYSDHIQRVPPPPPYADWRMAVWMLERSK
jgi:hypothetical protein